MANRTLLFIQLAALLAVTCAQQSIHQGGVESSELLRRRQEFQQANRLQNSETNQIQQARLQAEFQRSVDLANKALQTQTKQAQHVGAAITNRQQQFPTAPAVVNAPQRVQVGGVQTRTQSAIDNEDELFRKQAASAHYTFNSAINDGINDNMHIREESRDGLKVSGVYSYSDGFYKRTVFYEADEDGYRVVKEEVEPIGNGPKVDLGGSADVSTNISGVESQYRITTADIGRVHKDKVDREFVFNN